MGEGICRHAQYEADCDICIAIACAKDGCIEAMRESADLRAEVARLTEGLAHAKDMRIVAMRDANDMQARVDQLTHLYDLARRDITRLTAECKSSVICNDTLRIEQAKNNRALLMELSEEIAAVREAIR